MHLLIVNISKDFVKINIERSVGVSGHSSNM